MTTNTPPTHEDLLRRIRELEKEVAHLRNQVSHQQYGLVWMDVPEAFDTESLHSIPILEEENHLSFCQDDGKPTHILIEGDNYHSLTCLNYTHRNSIDVIYIDPPYNTGNDGFTYKDSRFISEQPNGQPLKKNH
ncbi:MAG: site-specific DNA-methyltransferase, partial [Bacteroidaceae bacterium]|nr:site-specific DNA-methyltransferase [Bacteroidaceae bacterium]